MKTILKVLGWLTVPYVMVGLAVSKKSGSKAYGAIAGIFSFFILIGLCGAMQDEQKTNVKTETAKTETIEQKSDLELISFDWKWEDGIAYVVGKVKNNTKHTYNYAQVSITLYDEDKNIVGNTLANVNDLEPDQIWKFKACVFNPEEVDTFKISEVDGW